MTSSGELALPYMLLGFLTMITFTFCVTLVVALQRRKAEMIGNEGEGEEGREGEEKLDSKS